MTTLATDRPVRGYPIRKVKSYADAGSPACVEDFCACPRGREGLRWALAGHVLLPALGALYSGTCCNAHGVRFYDGWEIGGVEEGRRHTGGALIWGFTNITGPIAPDLNIDQLRGCA